VQPMKAVARRTGKFRHMIDVRGHHVTIDEPVEQGGEDAAPSPQEMLAASLASCTAVTMEMYAQRKGWDLGYVEVECSYGPGERGCPTRFDLVLRLPDDATDEQVDRLKVIAAKCPVHRILDGEVMFHERVERLQLAKG
jgi:putative redox protein